MWIAFRFDEGDFLLPFAGREVRAQEQNHQPTFGVRQPAA
jgi:hypothetical protein